MAVLSLVLASACGGKGKIGGDDTNGDGGGPPDACVGLECKKVNCTGMGIGTTRLSGTIYAPNGTLPLYGASVYVPLNDPGPVAEGVTCDRCNDILPGNPTAKTTTDELGHFELDDVPVTDNLPVVVQMGKWRRQVTISAAPTACADNPIDPTLTRLPKNSSEGHIPKIAITTGNADALDCLVRKIGIEDKEISTDGGNGRVNLFSGNGANTFAGTFPNQGNFTDATALWSDLNKLKAYDILILSCEGSWPTARGNNVAGAASLKAVRDFADIGGRVFASHWHNYWIEEQAAVWPAIVTFADPPGSGDTHYDDTLGTINQGFDRGASMYKWLDGPIVNALNAQKLLVIKAGRNTALSIDTNKADKYVYYDPANSQGGASGVQDLQFTTPNDVDPQLRCGKVVFSDMHVSSTSSSAPGTPYPGGCDTGPLTPQEKALAFIFFDIASCVGPVVN
jgi:hypothetical protein